MRFWLALASVAILIAGCADGDARPKDDLPAPKESPAPGRPGGTHWEGEFLVHAGAPQRLELDGPPGELTVRWRLDHAVAMRVEVEGLPCELALVAGSAHLVIASGAVHTRSCGVIDGPLTVTLQTDGLAAGHLAFMT